MFKKNKKGALSSATVSIIILSTLFIILVLVFFDGDGLFEKGFRAIREMIYEVPDVEGNTGFFRNQENQLLFLKGYHDAMQSAKQQSVVSNGCLTELPSLESKGFYDDGYNLYIEQMPDNKISLRLTRSAKQDYEDDSAATHIPVATITVEDAKLCIIRGLSAKEFYNQLNTIDAGEVPDLTKIRPVPVDKILISSVREGGDKREIGYKISANDPDYTWANYFKKGTKTQPYLFRIDQFGQTYLCFFPVKTDFPGGVCSQPQPHEPIYLDIDCLDTDNGFQAIPTNMAKGLIPIQYHCGNNVVTDSKCLCGGTYEPNSQKCSSTSTFTEEQCQCATKIVGTSSGNFVTAGGQCVYSPAACTALLTKNPEYLMTKRADECS